MRRYTVLLTMAVVLLAAMGAVAGAAQSCDVPTLSGITIDGKAADWGDRGLRVELLTADDGTVRPAADLDARFRLGWNEDGLLLLVTVQDNTAGESPSIDTLWEGDSLEVFAAPRDRQPGEFLQFIISPGCDAKTPDLRYKPYDNRGEKLGEPVLQAARTKTADGYVVEALYPWKDLGLTPTRGLEFWFGLWVNDSDGSSRTQLAWAPRTDPVAGQQAGHLLRLAERAGAPVTAAVMGRYRSFRWVQADIVARETMAGEQAELRAGGTPVAQAVLTKRNGVATAQVRAPLPPRGQAVPELAIYVAGRPAGAVELPNLEDAQARAVLDLPFGFHPYAFNGPNFPECDFEQPNLAEDLLGPYTINTTFYDRDYRPVTSAEAPGRYGAVVEVTPQQGRPLTYFRALFRLPDGVDLWFFPRNPNMTATLPPLPGMTEAGLKANARALNELAQFGIAVNNGRDAGLAVLYAGLLEYRDGSPAVSPQDDVFAKDRQWWVGLKRKLSGMDQAYPADFVAPRPMEGAPATTLRAGTLAEAGMEPDTVEKLDALLTKWAADSDQGFAVFIARHGVIVLDKAYGQRDGRPMAVTDKSWMASISKLLAGTAMTMAVDRGRVDLTAPVGTYLPAFREVKLNKPLTTRHLYTHTAGLWGHWGDELHDFDQLIAWYGPHLQVGQRYEYDGAGLAMGGKVLEVVTGEALPLYYKHHLLDPLGMANTEIFTCSWDARSTARDMGTLAQMLLNRGAYGDRRFFGEAAFQQLLPRPLTDLLGPNTTNVYGLGTSFFENEGLGKGTWGHGAASSATLRIDPENDLVVAMTRNDADRNFGVYHPQFLKLVGECVVK